MGSKPPWDTGTSVCVCVCVVCACVCVSPHRRETGDSQTHLLFSDLRSHFVRLRGLCTLSLWPLTVPPQVHQAVLIYQRSAAAVAVSSAIMARGRATGAEEGGDEKGGVEGEIETPTKNCAISIECLFFPVCMRRCRLSSRSADCTARGRAKLREALARSRY